MKVFFTLLFHVFYIFIFSISALAQKEATNWFFGHYAGLSFINGYPTQLSGSQSISFANQNASAISDKDGSLLFYSDGYYIYDKTNHIMPSNVTLNHTSFSLIVPKPGPENLFYLFIADQSISTPGLRYSIIDMNLHGGLGDVTIQNQLISSATTWIFTATKHSNKKDTWLIAHEQNSNRFISYLVTASGISSPIYSSIGNIYSSNQYPYNNNIRSFKASPNGKKLALTFTDDFVGVTLDFFDFNNLTGNVSNSISLNNFENTQGIEFSPDSKYLYVSNGIKNGASFQISQIDLSSGNLTSIKKSIKVISTCTTSYPTTLQLAPDGKIYVSYAIFGHSIGAINDPNESGVACCYQDSVISITGSSNPNDGLTNFISSYLLPKFTYTHTCITDSTIFNIPDTTGVATVNWDFGDPSSAFLNNSNNFNPKHKFTSKGNFNVKLTFFFKDGSSQFYYYNVLIKDYLPQIDIGRDSSLCKDQRLEINPCYQGVSYLWSDSTGNPYYTASSSDTIWVEISNACNAVQDTIIVNFQEPPPLNIGKDTTLCYDIFPNVFLNATTTGASYQWNDGSTLAGLQVPNAGIYWVDVTVGKCTVRDSIKFSATSPAPVFHLGGDTVLCEKDTLLLNTFNSGAAYLWQDGSTSSYYKVYKPDTISITVTIGACIRKDTIIISYKPLPIIDLGNDTTVCPDTQILLDIYKPSYTYQWKDGSTQASYTIRSEDTVWVTATLNNCHKTDSVFVNYINSPVVNLGNDTTLCSGTSLLLSLHNELTSYLWNDGSQDTSKSILTSGQYYVKAVNQCGTAKDTVNVLFISAPHFSLGSDTVLCFHDTLYLALPAQYTYTWSDGSNQNNYIITSAGTYQVTAVNQCGASTFVKNVTNISCCMPYIPNLLTANNDGLNEELIISCIEDGQWRLEIYNRWGDRVFQSNDYHNELKGQQLPDGIYYYSLSKKGKDTYKGWLQVIR